MNKRKHRFSGQDLAKATTKTLLLWSEHKKYLRFKKIEYVWFENFLNEFRVGRGLSEERRSDLADYLNGSKTMVAIKNARNKPESVPLIDQLASELEQNHFNRLTSLSSKIAFFANPTIFHPYDSLNILGLQQLGEQIDDKCSYTLHAEAFERQYECYKESIEIACRKPHVTNLIQAFDLPHDLGSSKEFQKKVFDLLLMDLGKLKKNAA